MIESSGRINLKATNIRQHNEHVQYRLRDLMFHTDRLSLSCTYHRRSSIIDSFLLIDYRQSIILTSNGSPFDAAIIYHVIVLIVSFIVKLF